MNMEEVYLRELKKEIVILEGWIRETECGSWSTHLVIPMKKRVSYIKNLLYIP